MDDYKIDGLIAENVVGIQRNDFGEYRYALRLYQPSTRIDDAYLMEQKFFEDDGHVAITYINALMQEVGVENPQDLRYGALRDLIHATPKQRCLAALKTKGIKFQSNEGEEA